MSGIVWSAVIVGTIASFILGWLWYSPRLFGKPWAEGSGVSMESDGLPAFAMVAQLVGLFVLALVIGVTAVTNALFTALLAILAAALMVVANGAFCRKSGAALAIDAGYILLSGVVMIIARGALG